MTDRGKQTQKRGATFHRGHENTTIADYIDIKKSKSPYDCIRILSSCISAACLRIVASKVWLICNSDVFEISRSAILRLVRAASSCRLFSSASLLAAATLAAPDVGVLMGAERIRVDCREFCEEAPPGDVGGGASGIAEHMAVRILMDIPTG